MRRRYRRNMWNTKQQKGKQINRTTGGGATQAMLEKLNDWRAPSKGKANTMSPGCALEMKSLSTRTTEGATTAPIGEIEEVRKTKWENKTSGKD